MVLAYSFTKSTWPTFIEINAFPSKVGFSCIPLHAITENKTKTAMNDEIKILFFKVFIIISSSHFIQ